MAVSTLQKLTVAAVMVLCAALILPRVLLRRDPDHDPAQGQFPPMMHRHVAADLRGQRSAGARGHGEVRGAGGGGGAGTGGGGAGTGSSLGGKSNLAAQIIPVYGFGILLYILYILFKITSKGHSKPSQSRLQSLRSENNKRKITDFELSQLQEKLKETELVMENIVNNSLQEQDSLLLSVSLDQEQNLLQQLTEITRAMKSNHLDFTSNGRTMAEETDPCDLDLPWSRCSCHCPQTHEDPGLEEHHHLLHEDQDLPRCGEGLLHPEELYHEPQHQQTEEQQPQTERELQLHTAERENPEEEHQTTRRPEDSQRTSGPTDHLKTGADLQPQTENTAFSIQNAGGETQLREEHLRDTRTSEEELREEHLRDTKTSEEALKEGHLRDTRTSEEELREGHLRDTRTSEEELREEHLRDTRTSEEELREEHLRDTRTSEEELREEHLRDTRTSEEELREEHLRDTRTSEEELREKNLRDTKTSEEELREEHLRDTRTSEEELREKNLRDTKTSEEELREEHLRDTRTSEEEGAHGEMLSIETPLKEDQVKPREEGDITREGPLEEVVSEEQCLQNSEQKVYPRRGEAQTTVRRRNRRRRRRQ